MATDALWPWSRSVLAACVVGLAGVQGVHISCGMAAHSADSI